MRRVTYDSLQQKWQSRTFQSEGSEWRPAISFAAAIASSSVSYPPCHRPSGVVPPPKWPRPVLQKEQSDWCTRQKALVQFSYTK